MKSKRILVTGGTGFLGSQLVARLVSEGYYVRVLDNDSRGSKKRLQNISSKIHFIHGAIRNLSVVKKACQEIDCVFHLAFINGTAFFYQKPELVLDVGVKGIINVIDACLAHNVPEFFLASSSEVYQTPPKIPTNETVSLSIPDPLNPRYSYGGGKIISELMAINFGRKFFKRVVIFRPHNVYGPDMGYEHVIPQLSLKMKKLCLKTKGLVNFPIEGTGKETRSFVYIDDFIDGLMLLLKKGKHLNIYHVGTAQEISIEKVAQKIAKYFKRDIRVIPGILKKGGTTRRCPDITKISQLGFSPKITIEEGLGRTVAWYDAHSK